VVVRNCPTGLVVWQLNLDSDVNSVAYSPDGTTLAACLGFPSDSVLILDSQSGKIKSSLKVDYAVDCLTYAPNGDVLAVGDAGGNINFFNSQGEKLQSP